MLTGIINGYKALCSYTTEKFLTTPERKRVAAGAVAIVSAAVLLSRDPTTRMQYGETVASYLGKTAGNILIKVIAGRTMVVAADKALELGMYKGRVKKQRIH